MVASMPCDHICCPNCDYILQNRLLIKGIIKETSFCRGESSWCCLQPTRCSLLAYILRRQPTSPQAGGKGCGRILAQASLGWSRSRREGEETTPHLRGCRLSNHRRPLVLMKALITIPLRAVIQCYNNITQTNSEQHWDPDMKFVTSSTSSTSVKKIVARVKLSMGNAQSVFFPKV